MGKYILVYVLFFLASFACLSIAEAALSGSTPVGVTLPTSAETGLSNSKSVKQVLSGILNWMLSVVGIIALIGFAISGIMYLVSAGNDDMAKKAKSAMKFSILGIIVVLGSFVVIQAIDKAFSGTSFFPF